LSTSPAIAGLEEEALDAAEDLWDGLLLNEALVEEPEEVVAIS
jgi:hypothetical protein